MPLQDTPNLIFSHDVVSESIVYVLRFEMALLGFFDLFVMLISFNHIPFKKTHQQVNTHMLV